MPFVVVAEPGVETAKDQKHLEAELETLLRQLLQYGLFSKIA